MYAAAIQVGDGHHGDKSEQESSKTNDSETGTCNMGMLLQTVHDPTLSTSEDPYGVKTLISSTHHHPTHVLHCLQEHDCVLPDVFPWE